MSATAGQSTQPAPSSPYWQRPSQGSLWAQRAACAQLTQGASSGVFGAVAGSSRQLPEGVSQHPPGVANEQEFAVFPSGEDDDGARVNDGAAAQGRAVDLPVGVEYFDAAVGEDRWAGRPVWGVWRFAHPSLGVQVSVAGSQCCGTDETGWQTVSMAQVPQAPSRMVHVMMFTP